jgi:hypothetical protein
MTRHADFMEAFENCGCEGSSFRWKRIAGSSIHALKERRSVHPSAKAAFLGDYGSKGI